MSKENAPLLVIVGGFLGAGKTTLILKAVELLAKRGKRSAVILNDQDAGLVDTRHAMAQDVMAREVVDGCFCCRFSEFISAANDLAAYQPHVILAEPVGSCIDLAATVIRPIQTIYGDRLRVAPLTVLLDPATAKEARTDALDANMQFLFTHQLAEADIICTTKRDLYSREPQLPVPADWYLSGKTGLGVDGWLDDVLKMKRIVGAHLLAVDYSRYAEAEAALGWLNLHADVHLEAPLSPALLCGPLLDQIDNDATESEITIAHLKVFDRTSGGWLKASVCANGTAPVTDGDLLADPAIQHELALNLRAVADPERLRKITLSALGKINGRVHIRHLRAFRPPAPEPEHRLSAASA